MAADQGVAAAQFNLGRAYEGGRGLARDFVDAAKWYRKAADQGDAAAQFNLGVMYCNGRGVPKDYVEAHRWFKLAIQHFPESDTASRKRAITNRHLVAAKMTPTQLAEAQRLASEWKPR